MSHISFQKQGDELQYNTGSGWKAVPFIKTLDNHIVGSKQVEYWAFDTSNRAACNEFKKAINTTDNAFGITLDDSKEVFAITRDGREGRKLGSLNAIKEKPQKVEKPTIGAPPVKKDKDVVDKEEIKSPNQSTNLPSENEKVIKPEEAAVTSNDAKKEKQNKNKTIENIALASGAILLGKGIYDISKRPNNSENKEKSDHEKRKSKLSFATVGSIILGASLGAWALYVKTRDNSVAQKVER